VASALPSALHARWWGGPARFLSYGDIPFYVPYAVIAVVVVASVGWALSATRKHRVWIALGSIAGMAAGYYWLWRLWLIAGYD
jgi:hypothetical protein